MQGILIEAPTPTRLLSPSHQDKISVRLVDNPILATEVNEVRDRAYARLAYHPRKEQFIDLNLFNSAYDRVNGTGHNHLLASVTRSFPGESQTAAALLNDQVIGTMRITFGGHIAPLEISSLMTGIDPEITAIENQNSVGEIERFALDPNLNKAQQRTEATGLLYDQLMHIAREQGVEKLYAIMTPVVIRATSRAGIVANRIPGEPNYNSAAVAELVVAAPLYWAPRDTEQRPQLYQLEFERVLPD